MAKSNHGHCGCASAPQSAVEWGRRGVLGLGDRTDAGSSVDAEAGLQRTTLTIAGMDCPTEALIPRQARGHVRMLRSSIFNLIRRRLT